MRLLCDGGHWQQLTNRSQEAVAFISRETYFAPADVRQFIQDWYVYDSAELRSSRRDSPPYPMPGKDRRSIAARAGLLGARSERESPMHASDIISLIIQLISGAAGANLVGNLSDQFDLGVLGNSLVGIVAAGLGGLLLTHLLGHGSGASGDGHLLAFLMGYNAPAAHAGN